MIKIAHAIYDENGKSVGGKAGDQTGKEVCIWDWYKSGAGWTHVLRAKDASVAKKISETAKSIAQNDNIGYNQNDRTSLYSLAKVCDIDKITKACNCDCSAMVAVCINKAGVNISKDMHTGSEIALIKATGKFDVLTDGKYLMSADNLQDGDILFRKGHTAVAVDIRRKLQLTNPYMRGEDVEALQWLIGVEPDGVYGADTDKIVREILVLLGR